MAVSMRDLDPAFQGAGQKPGIEIWRIENFSPVPVSKSSYGKFFTGDSYIVLKTTGSKSGAFHHDIHYWLGKDTSQDEAGSAAVKTVELDAALGGRAVQYREVQGHETEKFLSCFKPCIIPQEGGIASGFKHPEAEKHITRLYLCRGKHVVHVKEVPFTRSSLSHDDVFILDTESKVFQFNGSKSSIQERAKALEVVQFIKETYHGGKCDIAAVEDGKLMSDPETGEFWGWFGGFAPLPKKVSSEDDMIVEKPTWKLLSVEKGKTEYIQTDCLTRELLDTDKCYILYCTLEVFVWMGRNTSLEERKSASTAAEELVRSSGHSKLHVIRVIEGFETVMFRCKFDSWPETIGVSVSEDGRGKVAALLKRQGVNVKGLLRTAPTKEEPQPHIDCSGNLQVWRVNGRSKKLLLASDQSKFYSGDCYIFQYSYPGEDKEECMIGTWFGKHSIEEERASARLLANTLIESLKFLPVRAHIHEGHEPIQFLSIFQSFIVYKGGLSEGYKDYIAKEGITDGTYMEDGVALFRVQGTGPDNMQAIQMDPVASSLNSSYCYIVHGGPSVFTWTGSLSTPEHQDLVERMLDMIKPNVQCKPQKEGVESEQFWNLFGGKSEYPSQKLGRDVDGDPHLFVCTSLTGDMKVVEIFNFSQDDLMAEDIYVLDCQSCIFVWVGQEVDPKNRMHALGVGEKFLERDFLLEKLARETPVYVITEGNEPPFFTLFFKWDAAKSAMHGNSFERKLMIVKNGGALPLDKPKRRSPVTYGGRSSMQDKSQRSRSVSFSPDRVRLRGRSPAFNALAANFENPNARNLSTPPPLVRKQLYPKSLTPPDTAKLASRSAAIAALGATFDKPPPAREPRPIKAFSPESDGRNLEDSVGSRIESLTIQEDIKGEAEDEENLPTYPYERLKTSSQDSVTDIDVTKREAYMSAEEFQQNFGMAKESFYKLPKWRQNKLKMTLQLF